MPRSVLTTTLVLAGLVGALGLWLGQRQVTLDSSAIIQRAAQHHVALHGGAVEDCVGLPGSGRSVIEVRCGSFIYAVDHLGLITQIDEGGI